MRSCANFILRFRDFTKRLKSLTPLSVSATPSKPRWSFSSPPRNAARAWDVTTGRTSFILIWTLTVLPPRRHAPQLHTGRQGIQDGLRSTFLADGRIFQLNQSGSGYLARRFTGHDHSHQSRLQWRQTWIVCRVLNIRTLVYH